MNVNISTSADGQRANTSLPFSFLIVRCGYVSFTEVGLLKQMCYMDISCRTGNGKSANVAHVENLSK